MFIWLILFPPDLNQIEECVMRKDTKTRIHRNYITNTHIKIDQFYIPLFYFVTHIAYTQTNKHI